MPLPAGDLISFAQLIFPPLHTSGLIAYKVEWLNSYAPGVGPYPIDLRGLSPSPRKDPQATWKYLIVAAPGLHGAAAAANVEAQLGAIMDALAGTYTYSGSYTTTSTTLPGTLGDLVVASTDGSAQYSCFARLDCAELKLEAGKSVYGYELPLTFHLLSDFV